MIKSANRLAYPSLLIKCAGVLAPNQLELLQKQQGQKQAGGLLFLFCACVFSWFFTCRLTQLSPPGYSRALNWCRKRANSPSWCLDQCLTFYFSYFVYESYLPHLTNRSCGFPVEGCVHGSRILRRSAHRVIIMCQIRVDRNKLLDIQNSLEEIAKYVFLIHIIGFMLAGALNLVSFLCRYGIWFESDGWDFDVNGPNLKLSLLFLNEFSFHSVVKTRGLQSVLPQL